VSQRIVTIGFGKKGAERFVELLKESEVNVVVDTRRRPDSPFSGYARQRDLRFILRTVGIGYEHKPELAPPNTLLDRYRKDHDWPAYVREFEEQVLATAEAKATMADLLARPETSALLCSEPTPARCHRRLVAERMQALDGTLAVEHLV
jgi:uncharacterized protein (DUF488 family)